MRQLAHKLAENHIRLIFAVTERMVKTYEVSGVGVLSNMGDRAFQLNEDETQRCHRLSSASTVWALGSGSTTWATTGFGSEQCRGGARGLFGPRDLYVGIKEGTFLSVTFSVSQDLSAFAATQHVLRVSRSRCAL